MPSSINPYLSEQDLIVLGNLFRDVDKNVREVSQPSDSKSSPEQIEAKSEDRPIVHDHDAEAINRMKSLNDPNSPDFQPTVFTTWDDKHIHPLLNEYLVRPYAKVASRIVRHPTDVVFFTHLLLYFSVNLPSAIWLFYSFTYIHGVLHTAFTVWCIGSFTLMMHNSIHANGILAKEWNWLDVTFPYILEPLIGHTWDSYYYHHIKHHHVEGNGPEDLSSTVWYQRDDLLNFLHYFGRFCLFIWLELPLYFIRKNEFGLAVKCFLSETSNYAFLYYMTTKVNTRASIFTLLLPLAILRLGLMVGNWGQHAFVDDVDPDSDFRSSITLIDVEANRLSFNDGYHTAHHLNPRRHWREQPVHFLQAKEAYRDGRALVFHNIGYFELTIRLLMKDYAHLAKCLVPMGDQIGLSQTEIAALLRTKTRKFTEEEIQEKFYGGAKRRARRGRVSAWARIGAMIRGAGGRVDLQSARAEVDMGSRKGQ